MKNFILSALILFTLQLTAQHKTGNTVAKVNTTDTVMNAYLNEINPDSIINSIQYLQDFTSRFMNDTINRHIAVNLQQKFISMGYQQTILDSFLTITNPNLPGTIFCDTTWQYNVIATLNGEVFPDSICIIGAHYDSFCDSALYGKKPVGADDNASGVAATLEIARIFKKMNYHPGLSIKFIAFGAEELMFSANQSGASFYAEKAMLNAEKIKFYINNDMLAYNTGLNDWHANIYCFNGMETLKDLAVSMCLQHTLLTPDVKYMNCPGDAYPFYLKGYQCIHIMENEMNSNIHTIFDLVTSLNKNYCAEICKITMAMLIEGAKTNTSIGIKETDLNASINIYPNPSSDRVYIQSLNKKEIKMQIFNAIGQLMQQEVLHNGLNEINIKALKKAYYFICLSGEDGILQKKLIVN